MNKKFISLIAASVMLGNTLPTTASPLAFLATLSATQAASFLSHADRYISERLPDRMRLSPDVLKKCYEAKKHTGIIRPVIFMSLPDEKPGETPLGMADSTRGLAGRVKLNQKALKLHDQNIHSITNTIDTIYHECGHIYHSHGYHSILLNFGLLVIPWYLAGTSGTPPEVVALTSALSCLTIEFRDRNEFRRRNDPATYQHYEYQADYTSYKTMATHNTASLKDKLKILIDLSQDGLGSKRRGSDKYPTHDESIALIYSALKGANQHQEFTDDLYVQNIAKNQRVLEGITQILGGEFERT